MSYVLFVGAKSDIARATAREYTRHGYDLYMAARNSAELADFANDIRIRTQRKVELLDLDVLDYDGHQAFYAGLSEKPIGVVCAAGYLGDQKKAESDLTEARRIIDTNYTGVMSLFNIIARDFEQRKSGFIVGISSVAGDRGRKSNYFYGAAKAALTAYLSGLRNRLYDSGIHVMTVKPGFVDTKMTRGMDLPKKLTAKPEEVAIDIYKGQQKRKDVLYTKWIWRWIMLVIKLIPEWKFKGMSI